MTLIDGDSYEEKNKERQEFKRVGENKAESKAKELSIRFKGIDCTSIPIYINNDTVSEVIQNNDIVFLCVDNHKTRKIVSEYCRTLSSVVLISGGNELLDGNVQIYVKKEGSELTPDLCRFHPEIANPEDQTPEEMSCEELSESEPQLFFVNAGIAVFMCCAFYNLISSDRIAGDETYVDFKLMVADTKRRVG
jgi:molybdopterin/thiamine biosynthesis adenylyltransferase